MGMYTSLILLILQVLNNLSVKQEDGESGGSTVEVLLGGGDGRSRGPGGAGDCCRYDRSQAPTKQEEEGVLQ